MKHSNSKIDSSQIVSHEEILELIDEIKEFEVTLEDLELKEPKIEEELIEVEPETEPIPIKIEEEKKQEPKPVKPTTFKIRFDEKGELVNIDFRKPKPKVEKKQKPGMKRFGRGKKKESGEEEPEGTTKGSKLKGRIGKLKKVIPGRRKKSKEPEETETKD